MENKSEIIRTYYTPLSMYKVEQNTEDFEYLQAIETYNEEGDLLSSIKYYPDGRENEVITNEFNEEGLLKKEQQLNHDTGVICRSEYEYNNLSNQVIENEYYGDDHICRINSIVNEKGDPLKIKQYQEEQLVSEESFSYNDAGEIVRHIIKDTFENTEEKISYEYKDNTQLLKETVKKDDSIVSKEKYVYDEQGHNISIVKHLEGENTVSKEQIFDKTGNIIEVKEFMNNEQVRVILNTFDEKNNLTSQECKDKTGYEFGNHYEYDSQNRVIKEVGFDNRYPENNSITRYEYEK